MGPKSEIEEQRFVECHMENWRTKKWLDSVEKQKKESIWRSVTDRQSQRQTRMVQLPATAAIEYVAACCRTRTRTRTKNENENENWKDN